MIYTISSLFYFLSTNSYFFSLVSSGLAFGIAFAAIDRPFTVWLERDLCFLFTVRTNCREHLSRAVIITISSKTHFIFHQFIFLIYKNRIFNLEISALKKEILKVEIQLSYIYPQKREPSI